MQTFHMIQRYVTSIINDNDDALTTRRGVLRSDLPLPAAIYRTIHAGRSLRHIPHAKLYVRRPVHPDEQDHQMVWINVRFCAERSGAVQVCQVDDSRCENLPPDSASRWPVE